VGETTTLLELLRTARSFSCAEKEKRAQVLYQSQVALNFHRLKRCINCSCEMAVTCPALKLAEERDHEIESTPKKFYA
jgi:hypothetical protein